MRRTILDSQPPVDPYLRGSVDVVIPVRDGEKTIFPTLTSVLDQTVTPRNIFVVDDGSKDDTANIVRGFGSGLIKLITTPPASISHARNTGIARSRAEFVAFLDADDRWHPDKLRRQLQVFTENNNAAVVYCGSALLDSSGAVRDIVAPSLSGFVLKDMLAGGYAGNSSCIIVRREALLQIGAYDETLIYGQDTDLLLRLARLYEFDFADDILTYVIQNPSSITLRQAGAEIHMEFLLARISVYEKWCPTNSISFRVAQAFRKQVMAAAVRRKYGWRWMLRLRANLLSRSPIMGRKVWRNHAIFGGWIALATLVYPIQLLTRKAKVAIWAIKTSTSSGYQESRARVGHAHAYTD